MRRPVLQDDGWQMPAAESVNSPAAACRPGVGLVWSLLLFFVVRVL